MRFSIVTITLLGATSALANTLVTRQAYPNCALACVTVADWKGCTDQACLCRNPDFVATTTACITKSCEGADRLKSYELGQAACRSVGVTLSSTPAPSATAAGGVSSSSASKTTRDTFLVMGAAAAAALAAFYF